MGTLAVDGEHRLQKTINKSEEAKVSFGFFVFERGNMSSRASKSKELRLTVRVQDALGQFERSSSAGKRQETEAVTHRCRVFRLDSKAVREGTSVYTVVWDTLERPFPSGALPKGEVYFATSGSSYDAVEGS